VPERVAPVSRQSKWADPRVSALGAALATAPFLFAKRPRRGGTPRPLKPLGRFLPGMGGYGMGVPGSLRSLALALRALRHEAEKAVAANHRNAFHVALLVTPWVVGDPATSAIPRDVR
jgi:hypothetical protein